MTKYKHNIDGLRALSIISVVIFHSGLNIMPGGYIGVDIFFLISGFLITSIIYKQYSEQSFSFRNFYLKRTYRLLPALLVMLFFVTLMSQNILLPSDLKEFYQSLIYSLFFAGNIYFWRNTDYFNPENESNPILHLWSLSIEEQYYLIFPLVFIYLLKRLKFKNVLLFLLFGCLISISVATFSSSVSYLRTGSFFLLPTRLWELGLGAFLALLVVKTGYKNSNIFSTIGLVVLITSFFIFDESYLHPSFYTAIPLFSLFLVIYYGNENTIVYKLLSNKFISFFGLISYSTYLWHQPLFSLYKYKANHVLSYFEIFFIIFLSFVLGYISWKFVENRYRYNFDVKNISFWKTSIVVIIFTLPLLLSSHLNEKNTQMLN